MNHETDNFQEEKQNESETLDLSMASCSDQCKRADALEDDTRTKPKQDIPVAFAIPAHEVRFVMERNIDCHYLEKHHLEQFAKETEL